ncbi:MAG: single-stranded DNA-binding protein [Nitrososphaera sp.]|nr:single-stranded DNA-binding protein [Nitrososphaera sp.]
MAHISIRGNLGADPEKKESDPGKGFLYFTLYENNYDGGQKQDPTIYTVRVYNAQADTCQKFLQKGSDVVVYGKLRVRKGQTGQTFLNVVADDVEFVGKLRADKQEG